ncbi:HEPN domain-containing protein [Cryobacterium breve]|uniref:HEPN domain-containing protein n=2 Tax=Microbacteriaceae TaxID=85023 RepID=A0ABY2J5X0_9MICO|nr:HEPN domain-containing protein [Cryobacterium sp. TmT3-12]TFC99777.1 HEPN domain-containing protein [Cryobacterium breve]
MLVNQGLKPRGEGAHAVLLEVAVAQLEPPRPSEIREFDWMRRLRNDTQYPDIGRASATVDDVDQAIPAARAIVDRAARLIELMPPC